MLIISSQSVKKKKRNANGLTHIQPALDPPWSFPTIPPLVPGSAATGRSGVMSKVGVGGDPDTTSAYDRSWLVICDIVLVSVCCGEGVV